MIKRGGEYERATAKWDLDIACEQIDLPANPVDDTVESLGRGLADQLESTKCTLESGLGKLIATAGRDGSAPTVRTSRRARR